MNSIEKDIPKYKKKSKKETPIKADHKHDYVKVIGEVIDANTGRVSYLPVKVCAICGKAAWHTIWFSTRNPEGTYNVLFKLDEIHKVYPDLKIVKFDSKQIW